MEQAQRPDAEALDQSLAQIRDAVKRQLGLERPPSADVDPETLTRFSPALPAELSAEQRRELEARVAELDPWLQGPFLLGGDLVVGGTWRNDLRWATLNGHVPDLAGKHVLDVGTNAGYDAFMFRLLGATRVLAIEPSDFIRQANFLEDIYRTGAEFERIGWQDLSPEDQGRFDVVHCNGVLYHELHPMRMLVRLRRMLNEDGVALIGSMMLRNPELSEYARFVPGDYYGDATWWWVPGRLAFRWMLEAAGFVLVKELPLGGGPPGHFGVDNGYMMVRAGGEPVYGAEDTASVRVRFPPGHYYSTLPDTRELGSRRIRARIWTPEPAPTPGIDWRDMQQAELCSNVFAHHDPLSFKAAPGEDSREYFSQNDQFPALDAWVLQAMLRHLEPRRMIEVGSGYSSLVTARVNREFLDERMQFTCIEPYPRDFLIDGVPGISDLRVEQVQDTPLEVFGELDRGDVLFVDTSHTVKTGGDVPWIYNEILPRLRQGVVVHLHDVFLPGDYPMEWVLDGWGWNELYLIQSFLAFNRAFEIVLGVQWMIQNHWDMLQAAFPEVARPEHRERGGGSLWIRRIE